MADELAYCILDLIFIFGSGFERGTFQQPMEPVTEQHPLCRSQQLMLCFALVLTRQVFYKLRVNQEPIVKLQMHEFDEKLQECTNVERIISEVV